MSLVVLTMFSVPLFGTVSITVFWVSLFYSMPLQQEITNIDSSMLEFQNRKIALIPGLLFVQFVLKIIHRSRRVAKNGEGLGTVIRRCGTQTSVWVLYCNTGLQTLAWLTMLILTRKNFAVELSLYILAPPPTPTSRPLTWWMSPSLPHFSPLFHFLNHTKLDSKTGEAWEQG